MKPETTNKNYTSKACQKQDKHKINVKPWESLLSPNLPWESVLKDII